MCRVNKPSEVIRSLIIEVFNNGKVSIVPDTMEGSELTIDELAACRDLIDLIIANPKNFHIVKTDPPVKEINTCDHIKMPLCRECKKELTNNTEFFTGICFDCEKAGILQRSNIQSTAIETRFSKITTPVKIVPVDVNAGQSSTMDDLDRVMANEPGYHIDDTQAATEAIPEPVPANVGLDIDDKYCSVVGCTNVINKKKYPLRWDAGICIKCKGKQKR